MENLSDSCSHINIAIVTAAGSGTRLMGDVKKQFRELCGIPIIIRTLGVFFASPIISKIIVTAPEEDIEYCDLLIREYFADTSKTWIVIPGGVERQDSIFGALQNCPADTDYVFIHDAVRPFINQKLILDLYEAVQEYLAVVPAAPSKHTIKLVEGDAVLYTLDRKKIILAFTPQVFAYKLIQTAYERAYQEGWNCTDDASVVELSGGKVHYLISSDLNLKITDENDLFFARAIIEKQLF